jgi:hypothetical protein
VRDVGIEVVIVFHQQSYRGKYEAAHHPSAFERTSYSYRADCFHCGNKSALASVRVQEGDSPNECETESNLKREVWFAGLIVR